MSRKFLNQKGLTPVILLILLVGGLVAGIYAFNYARTNLKPKAYDPNFNPVTTTEESVVEANCQNNTVMYEKCVDGQVINVTNRLKVSFSDQLGKDVTECVREEEPRGLSCAAYFCPDEGKEYCDPKVDGGKIIRKSRLAYEKGECVYDYKNTGKVCGDYSTKKELNISGYGTTAGNTENQAGWFCKAGTWNSDTCTLCNSAGSAYNNEGTDWGNYSANPTSWCACAKKYGDMYSSTYTTDNYPGCKDAPAPTTRTPDDITDF